MGLDRTRRTWALLGVKEAGVGVPIWLDPWAKKAMKTCSEGDVLHGDRARNLTECVSDRLKRWLGR